MEAKTNIDDKSEEGLRMALYKWMVEENNVEDCLY